MQKVKLAYSKIWIGANRSQQILEVKPTLIT